MTRVTVLRQLLGKPLVGPALSNSVFIQARNGHNVAQSRLKRQNLQEEFRNVFPRIVEELTEDKEYKHIPFAMNWQKEVLEINCTRGKLNRGFTVVDTSISLKNGKLTEEELQNAYIIGWGIEMMQSYYLIMDDYMDQSKTRRGLPCWYLTKNLGPKALNDGFLVLSSMFELFHKRFSGREFYRDLIHLFRNNGFKDKSAFDAVRDIAIPLGIYFQEQDDFIDLYGDPNITGKIGTDIQEGKCTWFAAQALTHGTNEQKKYFQEYYGSQRDEDIRKIRQFYDEMDMKKRFEIHVEQTLSKIKSDMENLPENIPSDIFSKIMKALEKREK
ncbi:probable farnesyl diphosphate synthase DDB_G0278823 isoform X2 [Artemia franciscana]|uniref:probable farnesyl diphosphate synthase DDB_G0278823 isoform X2 n=1 Tax=Artemia franciscana TaxID=6661 RepID=UPI0032D9ED8A